MRNGQSFHTTEITIGGFNKNRKTGKVLDVVRIDEAQRGHLDTVVKSTIEETLNGMLDAEADSLCGAVKYERSPERLDTRSGSYNRKLHTKAGEVTLKVPRLRGLPFETQIIERYKWREASVEESMVQMYLAGVSVRRVATYPAVRGSLNLVVNAQSGSGIFIAPTGRMKCP